MLLQNAATGASVAKTMSELTKHAVRRTFRPDEHFQLDQNGKLSDAGLAAFERDGFVAIDNIVGQAEITTMRETIARLHRNDTGFDEGANFDAASPADGSVTERRFPQILNPRAFAPELSETPYFQVAHNLAKQLIGDEARFKLDISFIKPPLIGSDTAWHQDEAFDNPGYDHSVITIWLALTRADNSNSCMSYIPGSNRMEILPHQPLGGDPRVHALECISGFDPAQAVEVPLDPGSVCIHACRTLHYAGPNQSNDVRMAYALLFDTKPTPRDVPHHFPWREVQHTQRATRLQKFRRRGGILIHIWRERHRLGLSTVMNELRGRIKRKWNTTKNSRR